MSARLRLDLIVRRYLDFGSLEDHDRWTWRLWSGSRIVATSGSQLYSRRIDCARGAEVGAGLEDVALSLRDDTCVPLRHTRDGRWEGVPLRIIDERTP